ncbi:hypothetical protein F2P81_018377 [Scophthalmus maximus]|uniref:Netrin-1-like n=1 Tax=Scophthalmus maximus TaxID=52904 RepID=A0A6A4SFV9_SCOMX|nr:hypothetical protein F2P81_018377 [Scophthalmus maximus]
MTRNVKTCETAPNPAHLLGRTAPEPRQAHGSKKKSVSRPRLDDMMFLPFSPPPSTSFFPVFLLLLLFLPPSLVSPSLFHTPLSWTSPHDPCYHLDGRPRHCLSEFINAAYGVPVHASHSQRGPEYDNSNITTLTDLHNPHNLTCWMAHRGTDAGQWVLTVPLGRRFEITYISLQFCQQGEPSDPISISVLKSMDSGRTWRPMQHYSSDCLGNFGLPSQTVAQTRHQETEPLCSDPRPLQKQRGGMVLAFSTLDGRPSSPDFDHSPTLQDWVTATDIRVVFHQVPKVVKTSGSNKDDRGQWRDGAEDHRGTGLMRWRAGHKGRTEEQVDKLDTDNTLAFFDREAKNSETSGRNRGEKVDKHGRKGHSKGSGQEEDGHNVTSQEGGDGFGLDTLISSKKGRKGRGQGHKKENDHWLPCPNGGCNWTVEGRSRGSKGRELRKRRNYNLNARQRARNLQVATPAAVVSPAHGPLGLSDVQVGGRCKCNGHASRCRRDDAGRAVCVCEHHTAGPDCDVCADFFFDRPWHRATPTQPNPCVACHCHPLGAVGRWCNQTSGQCLCRDGVTGLRCNRCAPGYKQGKSPLRPCILLKVQVRGMERSGPWWQFSISVQTVFRTGSPSRVRRGAHSLWVPDRDLGCGCPALHVGRTYLLIGAEEGERGWGPEESRLVADRSTLALQWREHWSPKLRGFRGQDKKGRCPPKSPDSRRREPSKPQSGYIPPHLLTEKDTGGVNTHPVKVDVTRTAAEPRTHPHAQESSESHKPRYGSKKHRPDLSSLASVAIWEIWRQRPTGRRWLWCRGVMRQMGELRFVEQPHCFGSGSVCDWWSVRPVIEIEERKIDPLTDECSV